MVTDHLEKLSTEAIDDFEAEQCLKELDQQQSWEMLRHACWAILTAECFPPRLGATYAAVQQVDRHPGWRQEFWDRFLAIPGGPTRSQLANWTSGHYYYAYHREDFDRFEELAKASPRDYDRRSIAVMLFTWRSYDTDEARVQEFMDKMLAARGEAS